MIGLAILLSSVSVYDNAKLNIIFDIDVIIEPKLNENVIFAEFGMCFGSPEVSNH